MNNVYDLNSRKELHKHKIDLSNLADQILDKQMSPHDKYEVVALLESMGWTDLQASKEFGVEDLFELSDLLWSEMQTKVMYTPFASESKKSARHITIELIRSFLRGLIFAFPMGVSVMAMLTLKFSLWSYQFLSVEMATAIAIGTILSFITVGGFTQAIARRGFFYITQGYYELARKNTFFFIRNGFLLCVLISVLLVVLNIVFNLFPYDMLFLMVGFYFFLNTIWLSVTVMYILRKELAFTGLLILGIAIVYLLFEVLNFYIIIAQLIALFVIAVLSTVLVLYYFYKEERKFEKGIALKLPRISIMIYSILPYFIYGFLYFTFLFIDRINAWSRNDEYMPYVIWFRGAYEVGLDFALLTIIIPMGIVEVIVTKMMLDLEGTQKGYLATESKSLYRVFVRKYYWMFFFTLLSAVVSSFIVYRLTLWFNEVYMQLNDENLLANPITKYVLILGIISYIILSICLMNAVILFAISQPTLVIKAIVPALLTNIVLGFILSRYFEYYYAVYGILIGAILMSILSTIYVRKVLKNIDYYLYAAS